ncbi:MAG: 3-mercaptopyruvate sulfurtransferase [Alphaproteobacteria bacterium]
MTANAFDSLVSTEWLAAHLDAPDIRVVDASWHLPGSGRNAKAEYAEHHVPGAVFFDIDDIADSASSLPHMLPGPEKFSSRVRKLGLGDGIRIVVYDWGGWMAAPRVWWMFRVFGHDDVAVLDGGLTKWRAEGRPVDDRPVMPRERHFTARMNTFLVRDIEQMRANLESRREQVIDARSSERFHGRTPEPRADLRGGHIPGSLNLPFNALIDKDAHTLLDPATIEARFAEAGVARGKPVVASCGSGVSACVLALGLHLVGRRDVAIYDGSWSEWGGRDDTPVET